MGLNTHLTILHSKGNKATTAILTLISLSSNILFMTRDSRITSHHPHARVSDISVVLVCFFFFFFHQLQILKLELSFSLMRLSKALTAGLQRAATANQCNIASNHKRGRHHLFYSQWLNIRAGLDDRLNGKCTTRRVRMPCRPA